MPDTPRTLDALQTLFAANTTMAITPQNLRDFLVSKMGGHAAIYTSAGVQNQAVDASPQQVDVFTNNSGDSQQATPDWENSHIVIDVGGTWLATFNASFTGTGGAPFYGHITCTGSGTVFGGGWERKLAPTADVGTATAFAVITGAEANDTVECTINSNGSPYVWRPSEMSLVITRLA